MNNSAAGATMGINSGTPSQSAVFNTPPMANTTEMTIKFMFKRSGTVGESKATIIGDTPLLRASTQKKNENKKKWMRRM